MLSTRRQADMGMVEIQNKKEHPIEGGSSTQSEDRVRVLAALLFANLGGSATIQESGKGQLSVAIPDGPIFTIKLGKSVTFNGSPDSPNVDQFIGTFEEDEDELAALNDIANNAITLIQEALESDGPPSPVYFKGQAPAPNEEDDVGEMGEPDEGGATTNPAPGDMMPAPGAEPSVDQVTNEMGGFNPNQGMPDQGMQPFSMPPQPIPQQFSQPGMGAPPMSNPGMMPPQPQQPFPMAPAASGRRKARFITREELLSGNAGEPVVDEQMKPITATLEQLATDLEKAGDKKLAARIDRVTNTLEQRLAKAKNNPWAICHGTVDRKREPDKYERCVRQVEKKQSSRQASIDQITEQLNALGYDWKDANDKHDSILHEFYWEGDGPAPLEKAKQIVRAGGLSILQNDENGVVVEEPLESRQSSRQAASVEEFESLLRMAADCISRMKGNNDYSGYIRQQLSRLQEYVNRLKACADSLTDNV